MSTRLPDPPTTVEPILNGKFVQNWIGWFLALQLGVQDLQVSVPIAVTAAGPISGPGPVSISIPITMRRPGTLTVFCNLLQEWVTAAPSWKVEIQVDTTVYSTGVISNSWQSLVSPTVQMPVGAGAHNVVFTWTAGNANAFLDNISLVVFPTYTV